MAHPPDDQCPLDRGRDRPLPNDLVGPQGSLRCGRGPAPRWSPRHDLACFAQELVAYLHASLGRADRASKTPCQVDHASRPSVPSAAQVVTPVAGMISTHQPGPSTLPRRPPAVVPNVHPLGGGPQRILHSPRGLPRVLQGIRQTPRGLPEGPPTNPACAEEPPRSPPPHPPNTKRPPRSPPAYPANV